jgi:hypothetical protein
MIASLTTLADDAASELAAIAAAATAMAASGSKSFHLRLFSRLMLCPPPEMVSKRVQRATLRRFENA